LHASDKLLKLAEANYPDLEDKQQIDKYAGALSPNVTEMFNYEAPDVRG
jgi:hypothetical protein